MRYQRILKELLRDKTQADLARELGVTQPTVARWLSGSEPKTKHHDKILAKAKEVHVINIREDVERTVPIVGYVGAGGSILYSDGQGPFGDAPMPPNGATPDTVAVVVRGDSMSGQLEDGWTVYYDQRHEAPTPAILNKLCVIGLSDGRVLIKKLYPGRRDGAYDLFSANASPMIDQPVIWAAPVVWIKPA